MLWLLVLLAALRWLSAREIISDADSLLQEKLVRSVFVRLLIDAYMFPVLDQGLNKLAEINTVFVFYDVVKNL